MKRVFQVALVLAGCVTLGCSSSATTGGDAAGKSFKITGPTVTPTIKQGTTQTIELSVSRDKEFKEDIALSPEHGKELTVKLDPSTYKASDDGKVKMEVTVDKEAAIAEHTIKITGKPAKGTASTTDVKIKVEK